MIPEVGHFSLILALVISAFAAVAPALRRDGSLLNLQQRVVHLQFALLSLSMLILGYSFLTNDFSVAYVAQNSNTKLPWLYQLGAIWGAHEGSMLLWVWILSLWSFAITLFSSRLDRQFTSQLLWVLCLIACGFLLFILATSNPFIRLLPVSPVDGRDLNPLLQDPGLVLHPPVLYMGYVGYALPFAFACAALMRGKLEADWLRWLRPWVVAAWCFLTIGITMGSWWAYRELGWGGWWFWDPVENASFLPWLLGTALLHSVAVTAKRGQFTAWTILLAIGCFALSLIGTFLVRSGVLVSVHAFANDSTRGAYILAFLAAVLVSSLGLYALRGHTLSQRVKLSMWSTEMLLLCNNALLVVAMLTVLLGTLYPLIVDALGLGKLSVGPPYFNAVFVPIMTPLLFLMAWVPQAKWGQNSWAAIRRECSIYFPIALAVGVLVPWTITGQFRIGVVLGVSLSTLLVLSTFSAIRPQRQHVTTARRQGRWAMRFAHLGVAVTALGIVLSSAFSQHREVRMQIGDDVQVGPYQFQLRAVEEIPGPNYKALQAEVRLRQGEQPWVSLYPEQRLFQVQKMALAKTAIDAGLFRDCYVALGQPLDHDAWALRIYYKPFIRWIWAGGFLMLLGGLLAVWRHVRGLVSSRALARRKPQPLQERRV